MGSVSRTAPVVAFALAFVSIIFLSADVGSGGFADRPCKIGGSFCDRPSLSLIPSSLVIGWAFMIRGTD